MHLIQILLPLCATEQETAERLRQVRQELTSRFGGLTLHRNAPAEGLWKDEGTVERDSIVIAEVMADELDRAWWDAYRMKLERRFQQEQIVIRAVPATRL